MSKDSPTMDEVYGQGAEAADTVAQKQAALLEEVLRERLRQMEAAKSGGPAAFDDSYTKNDWVAFITAYAGRAAGNVPRNERQGEEFRPNMVKVAALALAALEAYDNGAFHLN